MKCIEIESCSRCPFAYENEKKLLTCEMSKRVVEHVVSQGVASTCPLKNGPIQFALSKRKRREDEDIASKKKCRDCGAEFSITYGELRFLEETFGPSFGEPTRCSSCRKKRRENGGAQ